MVGAFFRRHVAEPLGIDFYIGLGAEHDARTSDLHGGVADLQPPRGGDDPTGVRRPDGLLALAMSNPPQAPSAHNTRAWRAAEIPAANGHGNARALATIYGALACGGEDAAGVRILDQATIARATREESFGRDAVLGVPTRFGLGFALSHEASPMSRCPHAFGHSGTGGSLGMADPDARVGFGFTPNKMHMGPAMFEGAHALVRAFYASLG